jgi:metal-responsive CopG/Arc/MetJ family transcriptional regulator
MRILVDLPDRLLRELNELSRRRKISRAALIREAVLTHVIKHQSAAIEDAFGAWGGGGDDGLAYQEKIRSEW